MKAGQSDWIETVTALPPPERARRFLADCRGSTGPAAIVDDDPEQAAFLLLVDLGDETLAQIAQWRYGLAKWPLLTLDQIGANLGLGRQRADELLRQLLSAAKKRLADSAELSAKGAV